ncbi:hypothetical protein [Micrococcus sp.]|uniref:hypothetical protein n=1 Tax=Micrococcus sp. TaxID=1271 RepID=UPI002A911F0C|nr:hypothetical protein [Micrococcus sp.]MDY6056139.1 hypothetical protein [Micrococcus sp.]
MTTPARRPARNTNLASKVSLYSTQKAPEAPATDFQDVPELDTPAPTPAAQDAAPSSQAPAAAELPAYTPPKKAQVKAYVPAETAERFQDAWHACRGITGHRYLSDHISALLAAEAARLEAEHNGGNRFPPRNG